MTEILFSLNFFDTAESKASILIRKLLSSAQIIHCDRPKVLSLSDDFVFIN